MNPGQKSTFKVWILFSKLYIAYKTFGKGEPILLIYSLGMKMDSWEPTLLSLSLNN
jgi:hypothetical protein